MGKEDVVKNATTELVGKTEELKEQKINCDTTDCNNCVNHKYCDYEYKPIVIDSEVDLKELKSLIDNNPLCSVMPEPIETKAEILNGVSKELTRLAINYFNLKPEFNDYLKALNDVQDYIDKELKGD